MGVGWIGTPGGSPVAQQSQPRTDSMAQLPQPLEIIDWRAMAIAPNFLKTESAY